MRQAHDGNTIRQRFNSALAGEPAARPVYAVYDWFVKNRPHVDWPALSAAGLGQIHHVDLVQYERPHLRIEESSREDGGRIRRDIRWITDIGELHTWYMGEWRQEHLIKSPQDYRILARALADERAVPDPQALAQAESAAGDGGIVLGQLGRTPMQEVQIDYAGLERFSFDLADQTSELMQLLEQMDAQKLAAFEAAAQVPARYIKLWENLTIETMGAEIYRRHLVPLYRQIFQRLDRSGQRLLVHYDGKLRPIAGDIAELPFDGIDSFTPPPEGDMSVAEARAAWPEKFLWLHPPLGWYELPEPQLDAAVRGMIDDAGRRRCCLMISEDIPPHWQRTIPAVLAAVNTMRSPAAGAGR